jgi:hypothetical protein
VLPDGAEHDASEQEGHPGGQPPPRVVLVHARLARGGRGAHGPRAAAVEEATYRSGLPSPEITPGRPAGEPRRVAKRPAAAMVTGNRYRPMVRMVRRLSDPSAPTVSRAQNHGQMLVLIRSPWPTAEAEGTAGLLWP